MLAAQKQHYYYHGSVSHSATVWHHKCHFCQIQRMPQQKHLPVTIINKLDDTPLPPEFEFIEGYLLNRGVQPAEDSFRSGCDCGGDGAGCRLDTCQCLSEVDWEDNDDRRENDDDDDDDGAGAGTPNGKEAYAYVTAGERRGLLKHKMLRSTRPIYECHSACSCSDKCPNRVVQRGRTVPLQIFRTADRGWGVRSPVPIKKGQFVDCYIGEVLTEGDANVRRRAKDGKGGASSSSSSPSRQKDIYLFALDKFHDPDSHDVRLRVPLEVDGEYRSGPTRFVNHSCDPNMRIFARVGDHADKHLHDLAFFAVRDIPPGEELTFDYVDGVADEPEVGAAAHFATCLCKSDNCRGYLF